MPVTWVITARHHHGQWAYLAKRTAPGVRVRTCRVVVVVVVVVAVHAFRHIEGCSYQWAWAVSGTSARIRIPSADTARICWNSEILGCNGRRSAPRCQIRALTMVVVAATTTKTCASVAFVPGATRCDGVQPSSSFE